MSKREKMGWDEKGHYIALAIGLALAVWCVVDFDGLARIVTSPVTAVVAPIVVGGALFLFLGGMAFPYVILLREQRRNATLKEKLAKTGQKMSATILKLKKDDLQVNNSPLVRVTVEAQDYGKKTFWIFAKEKEYTTKVGDKITLLYNPMNPDEMVPLDELK